MRKPMRYLALAFAAILLVSCSRDPNYLKAKYLQSGKKYYDAGRYKEASIMFRKSIESDRKYGLAYYELALTELKLNQLANSIPALRRAHELLKPGTTEANDTDLKLAEIMVMAAQTQSNNDQIIKDIQQIVTGLLYIAAETADLHGHLNTVSAPLNALNEKELCPGSAALDKINASLR